MKRLLSIVCWLAVAAAIPSLASNNESQNDILIVVNNSNPVNSLFLDDVKAIFSKKMVLWSSGQKTVPLHSKDARLKEQFLKRVFNQTINDDRVYWQQEKIKKGTTPPVELDQTLKGVFKIKGAISYVFRSDYANSVAKVVLVVPE